MTAPRSEVVESEPRVNRWEDATELPLALAAMLFLVVYALPILDTGLTHAEHRSCDITAYVLWALFIVDFLVRVALAERRGHYAFRHTPELLTLALPVLRPLRLLRLVVLLRVLNRRATTSLRGRVALYVLSGTGLIIFCASLAELDAERDHPGAVITTFGDSLWWAFTTITTVGYGDTYPVTTEGRMVAIGLMIAGIALLGVVTASLASWFVDRVREIDEEEATANAAEMRALRAEIAELRTLIVAKTH